MPGTQQVFQLETVHMNDDGTELTILDQTQLPGELVYKKLYTVKAVWEAIRRLEVRGAPAIGVTAAYGVVLAMMEQQMESGTELMSAFRKHKAYLETSRPTAVNLFWALDRIQDCLIRNQYEKTSTIKKAILQEAHDIKNQDIQVCRMIGEHGLSLLRPGMGLLTHCNAGQLATSRYGTALAPMYLGHERGYGFRVFAGETRPLLQGARLTTFELQQAGIDVTLICDSMAATVMKNGWVQAVFTGCDRLASNGDAANKIGTSGIAILAKHYEIPFYICVPMSTIDRQCESGQDIEIEERDAGEVTHLWYQKPMAPEGVSVFNPAFDITEGELISGIVTERGVILPPYRENLAALFRKGREEAK